MLEVSGSWSVQYAGGGGLSQYEGGVEQGMGKIDWGRVERLRFESQWAVGDFPVTPLGPEFDTRLIARVYQRANESCLRAFVVLVSDAGAELSDESVRYAHYWFPDGATHETDQYNSSHAAAYAAALLAGEPIPLMPEAYRIAADLTADLL